MMYAAKRSAMHPEFNMKAIITGFLQ